MLEFINIRDLGAVGDGVADETGVFQKALQKDDIRLFIPDGEYRIKAPLRLRSGTWVRAASQAVIRLADGAGTSGEICLLTNADHVNGNRDITVEGGVWDANCAANPRGEDLDLEAYSGVAIKLFKVKGLHLRGLRVCNPDSFFILLGETENFTVEKVDFSATLVRPNQDGLHLGGGCRNGIIRDLTGVTPSTPNDDMVALNADDGYERHFNHGTVPGTIENILIDNLKVQDVYTFVRLLSCGSLIKNVQISNLSGTVKWYAINANNWRFPKGLGRQENIVIRNIAVAKDNSPDNAGREQPLIKICQRIDNFLLDGFTRLDSSPSSAPTLVLDNQTVNTLALEGLDAEQGEELQKTLPEAMFIPSADAKALPAVTTDSIITLSGGNIDRMSLNDGESK
jgi:polygalacturonase